MEELEAYVGYKLEKGDRLKAFILTYLNRDFEPVEESYKKSIGQRGVKYYKGKKETILQRQATYFKNNVEEKCFYCGACDVACISNYALKKHFETLKHSRLGVNAAYGKKNKETRRF